MESAPSASGEVDAEAIETRLWRRRMYPIGILAALGVALVVLALAADRGSTPAKDVGGDFPAFYGAARIAADGDWATLYDFDRQVAAQADLQETAGSARYFAYPPQVALAHAPLAALSYGQAYLVFTAVMFLALVGAVKLAEPMLPWLDGNTWFAAAIAMTFWPMLRAVTGGSNSALSLLLIVGAWRLIHDGHDLAGGFVLAALLFKPQLAIPLIGLMLIVGLSRVVAGAALGAGLFYLAGVPLTGWGWPLEWWERARAFNLLDSEVNGFSSVSWLGFLENGRGVGDPVAVTVGWMLAGLTTLALVWIWRKNGARRLAPLLAVAMPGILLLSPHALSHDTAILLLSFAVLHQRRQLPTWLVAIAWAIGLSMMWIEDIGFSPGFFMLVFVACWTATRLDLVGFGRTDAMAAA